HRGGAWEAVARRSGAERQEPEHAPRLQVEVDAHRQAPGRQASRPGDDRRREQAARPPADGGVSAASIHHVHIVGRAAFNEAIRWCGLDRNPVTWARPPEYRPEEIKPP